MTRSQVLFQKAQEVIPGGVNSPVRAFRSVGDVPRFIKSAKGSRIHDVDGNEYIDFVGSWGPMILGHAYPDIVEAVTAAAQFGLSFGAATEAEITMAELICEMVPSVEMVRLVNSGTEAVMSALRVARGYTGRPKIIKFEGCYHGHGDSMLVKAGSGVMTAGIPDSLGVPAGCAGDTLTAVYNDLDSVQKLFEENKNEIAAVILELVPANMGVILPQEGFLHDLKKMCEENGALLIADEVITGFRLGPGGAQAFFNIKADLTTFGKIIGAGMPVGAYGGRKEIMQMVAPCGGVYQAGTLSGNPLATAAGIAQLSILKSKPEVYSQINHLSLKLSEGLNSLINIYGLNARVNQIGSLSCLFFTEKEVTNYDQVKSSDTGLFARYFQIMINKGIYLAPSQFEAIFMSYAHSQEDIDYTLQCAEDAFKSMK
ncbi:MAG: glutamate-1-semialdehyde 2,1-aminomutase [Peptococcaceae bacterium]|nr:glutamate-1-semialdehyde 2,1-aminomutase [Peptococcaceae bacterium]